MLRIDAGPAMSERLLLPRSADLSRQRRLAPRPQACGGRMVKATGEQRGLLFGAPYSNRVCIIGHTHLPKLTYELLREMSTVRAKPPGPVW